MAGGDKHVGREILEVGALGADELEVLDDHRQLAALALAHLVVPRVVLEAALDEERLALGAVLGDRLGLAAEGGAVDERRLLLVLARRGAVAAVAGEAELRDDRVARQVLDLRSEE